MTYVDPINALNDAKREIRTALNQKPQSTGSVPLSRRDYFAAAAMQGIISTGNENNYPVLIQSAVMCADALIRELDKNG